MQTIKVILYIFGLALLIIAWVVAAMASYMILPVLFFIYIIVGLVSDERTNRDDSGGNS